MKRFFITGLAVVSMVAVTIISCVHKSYVPPADGNFPPAVGAIFISKCAISGCHNAASYQNANNLLLDSWEHLFNGGNSGAEVVPYSPAYSPLLYFTNTDSTLGPVATPSMPLSTSSKASVPLTKAEYETLSSWIANGAPDKNGNVAFATDAATRQKIYITQQGCDLLAVIDAKSRLIMRYIPIGLINGQTESPHDVEISSDGMYAYVPLYNGNYVQKIDTKTDQVAANANLTSATTFGTTGGWSIVILSPRDTSLMVTGYVTPGYIVNINTASMTMNQSLSIDQGTGFPAAPFAYPHGIESNPTFDTFFVALQYGNSILKYSRKNASSPYFKYISVNGLTATTTAPTDSFSPNPHQVQMTPDNSKYFVTCQGTGQVVVVDAHADTIITKIQVGAFPQEMDIYPAKNYLFVACMEDAQTTHEGSLGSVYVIDYTHMKVVDKIYGDFYQPHDVSVDAQDGLLYITSTNYSPSGPPPHHVTSCGSRAGWYTVYDLNTLKPADNKRYELTYFPYASSARFK